MSKICHECGGTITTKPATGLKWEVIPGVPMDIPASIRIARCDSCDDYALDDAQTRDIEEALEPAAKAWIAAEIARSISFLKARDRVTTTQIEAAAGVTPTYLSHASHPTRSKASLQLLRLLQAFVACPEELKRHLHRRPRPAFPAWWDTETGTQRASAPGWAGGNASRRLRLTKPANDVTYSPAAITPAPAASKDCAQTDVAA